MFKWKANPNDAAQWTNERIHWYFHKIAICKRLAKAIVSFEWINFYLISIILFILGCYHCRIRIQENDLMRSNKVSRNTRKKRIFCLCMYIACQSSNAIVLGSRISPYIFEMSISNASMMTTLIYYGGSNFWLHVADSIHWM